MSESTLPDASALGSVTLIGAGPGDPELLTLKAVRVLGEAEVVLHDALIDQRVLGLAHPDAELIDVGKRKGKPVSQVMICELLVALARDGKRVVRLKGGDPFVFGRGGEEALALGAAGITCDVVPGVSSSVAAPALAGIPVTHRELSRSFTVVTGTTADGTNGADWAALAKTGGTLVILMGVTHRGDIARALITGGLDPQTPAAAISDAASEFQAVSRCSLVDLGDLEVASPAVLVIGAVAALDVLDTADPNVAATPLLDLAPLAGP
ncbi:MAG: uroporphyrinogen-III C-methyltransferase [Microthrixaceae bacterium]